MTRIVLRGVERPLDENRRLVVDELVVESGARCVVFGPNGAGKSTLLRFMAGTIPGSSSAGPDAAYLPQRPYLFRGSAAWNLSLGLAPEARSRANELAGAFGIADRLERRARALSGGERQRLALARTLARPEPVLLLDEPLTPLDERDRMAAARIIVDAIGNRTAVIVTHDPEEAAVLGDVIAVLADGEIRQIGPVGDVFSLPADDVVAAVVGIGNVLGGSVTAVDGPLAAVAAGPLTVWGVGDIGLEEPAKALFGAEAVTIFAGKDVNVGSARNTWTGEVVEIRSVGRLIEVFVDAGVPIAALVTPGSLDAIGVAAGDQVTLTVKATAVRVVPG